MQLRGGLQVSGVQECNFFDRFGNKEQTGIGGRSRVQPIVPPQPRSGFEGGGYAPAVKTHHSHSPPPFRAQALSSSPPPAPLRDSTDAMLLMGLMPSHDTFRTSAVLQPPNPVLGAKRRTVDFVHEDVDGSFFEDIDRLRHSQATTQLSDSNIYGTPLRVSAAREEALRRRPSWDRGWDDDDAVPQQNNHSPVGRQQLAPLPNVPRGDNGGAREEKRSVHHHPHKRPLEPLATQEAHVLESQLRQLKRGGPPPHARDPHPTRKASPASHNQQRKPPPPSLSPIRYRTDVANVPGAMYSRPIPAIVASVLYGQQQARSNPTTIATTTSTAAASAGEDVQRNHPHNNQRRYAPPPLAARW